VELQLGEASLVTASLEESAGSIDPPNAASNTLSLNYMPSVSISTLPHIDVDGVTTMTALTITVTFGSDVTGADAAMLAITGGVLSAFQSVSSTQYTFEATLGSSSSVCLTFEGASGKTGVSPAPGNASDVCFTYEPAVTLAWLEVVGSRTSSAHVNATVSFSSPVTGFSSAALIATGAAITAVTPASLANSFLVELQLGSSASVAVSIPRHADGVNPPNAASSPTTLDLTFEPLPQLRWDGLANGSSTTDPEATVIYHFDTDVTGAASTDVVVTGGVVGSASNCGAACIMLPIALSSAEVSVRVPRHTGDLSPANSPSAVLTLEFTPLFTWSRSDGKELGAPTSQTELTVIAALPALLSVQGVASTSFLVSGATLVQFSPSVGSNMFVCCRVSSSILDVVTLQLLTGTHST